ncbi:MAG: PhoH family protein, partial [Polaromonas sp.]|nr:PhoH family protein [Polaromonas sp.]
MPLPPAPTKRAALLSSDAMDAPARSPSKAVQRTGSSARNPKPPVLDLFDSRSTHAGGADHPAEFKGKDAPSPIDASASSYKKSSDERPKTVAQAKPVKKPKHTGPAKLFVLDTNVLMHDPMCLFRFEEHDIFLPMIVLEELDGHKKGMTEVARNARQTSRSLDALAGAKDAEITKGLRLDTTGHREAKGCLLFQTKPLDYTLPVSLPQGKADNQILGVVEALRKEYAPREVVLVSKDINMRV